MEVIDIIHSISYEVNKKGLEDVAKLINDQLDAIQKSKEQLKTLNQLYSQTKDKAEQQKLKVDIDKTNTSLATQGKALIDIISSNKQFNAILNQQGSQVDALKTKYDLLNKVKQLNTGDANNKLIDGLVGGAGGIKEKLKSAGGGALTDVIGGIAGGGDVIESVTGAINGMSGAFGVLGLVAAPAIGYVIKKLYEMATAETEAEKNQKILSAAFDEAGKIAANDVAHLEVLKYKINDVSTSTEERTKLVHEYNKIADDGNKIADSEINNLDKINERIQQQILLIGKRALAKAAENQLTEEANKLIIAEEKFIANTQSKTLEEAKKKVEEYQQQVKESENIAKDLNNRTRSDAFAAKTNQTLKSVATNLNAASLAYYSAKKAFDKKLEVLAPLITVEGLTTKDKTEIEKKVLEKHYAELKDTEIDLIRKYKDELLKAKEREELKDEIGIKANAEKNLNIRLEEIQKAEDEYNKKAQEQGKPTKKFTLAIQSAKDLQEYEQNTNIQNALKDREKLYKDFGLRIQKVKEDGAISSLKNAIKNEANERALLIAEFKKTKDEINQQKQKALDDLNEKLNKGMLGNVKRDDTGKPVKDANGNAQLIEAKDLEKYNNLKLKIDNAYNSKVGAATVEKNNKLKELNLKYFEQLITETLNAFHVLNDANIQGENKQLESLNDLLRQKKISILKYNDEVKNADLKLNKDRIDNDLKANQTAIDKINDRLKLLDKESEEAKKLTKELENLNKARNGLLKEQGQNEAETQKKHSDEIKKKIDLYKQLVDAVLNAWSTILKAEEDAVDREIAVREKRVEKSNKIADRGNAEALQIEEKKLEAAQEQKRKFARQQMAINLIQQASNLALAVAQAAAVQFPANIPAIAAVIGAVASGFATVKQLTSENEEKFADGVVGYRGKGTGRSDSNSVRISNGESIITADGTQRNKNVLEQINKGAKFKLATMENVRTIAQPFVFDKSQPNGNENLKQDFKDMKQELTGIKEAIKEKQPTQLHFDRRGVVAIVEEVVSKDRKKWRV